MAILIGAILALSVGLSATFLGLDRDRAFYPTVMIVIASYYALFAVVGGSSHAVATESIVRRPLLRILGRHRGHRLRGEEGVLFRARRSTGSALPDPLFVRSTTRLGRLLGVDRGLLPLAPPRRAGRGAVNPVGNSALAAATGRSPR